MSFFALALAAVGLCRGAFATHHTAPTYRGALLYLDFAAGDVLTLAQLDLTSNTSSNLVGLGQGGSFFDMVSTTTADGNMYIATVQYKGAPLDPYHPSDQCAPPCAAGNSCCTVDPTKYVSYTPPQPAPPTYRNHPPLRRDVVFFFDVRTHTYTHATHARMTDTRAHASACQTVPSSTLEVSSTGKPSPCNCIPM